MGQYNPDNIVVSDKAREVFERVFVKETYASEVAEDLDMDRSMASEILNNLEKAGFIYVSKRKKAKYYQIDYDGIIDRIFNPTHIQIPEDHLEDNFLVEKGIDEEIVIEDFKNNLRESFKEFLPNYTEKRIEENHINSLTHFEDSSLRTYIGNSLARYNFSYEEMESEKITKEIVEWWRRRTLSHPI